ncbi:hypothetical protein F4604DRAFT_1921815 [Suillus subluteus]|nr:hypothetical protein F4604DRAFT_1921815 [Suillus subluteus]
MLQHIPTNKKFDQLEKTMFENFCIAQSLHSLISTGQLPEILSQFVHVFTKTFRVNRSRGTLISDSKAFKTRFYVKPDAASDASPLCCLSVSLCSAIQTWNTDPKNHSEGSLLGVATNKLCSPVAKAHHSLEKDGIVYKPHTAPRYKDKEPPHPSGTLSAFNIRNDYLDSDGNDLKSSIDTAHCFIAFCNDTLSWLAGRIREILTHESQILLVVDPFRALSPADAHHDYYHMYPWAGGRIFNDEPESCPVIISPMQLKLLEHPFRSGLSGIDGAYQFTVICFADFATIDSNDVWQSLLEEPRLRELAAHNHVLAYIILPVGICIWMEWTGTQSQMPGLPSWAGVFMWDLPAGRRLVL